MNDLETELAELAALLRKHIFKTRCPVCSRFGVFDTHRMSARATSMTHRCLTDFLLKGRVEIGPRLSSHSPDSLLRTGWHVKFSGVPIHWLWRSRGDRSGDWRRPVSRLFERIDDYDLSRIEQPSSLRWKRFGYRLLLGSFPRLPDVLGKGEDLAFFRIADQPGIIGHQGLLVGTGSQGPVEIEQAQRKLCEQYSAAFVRTAADDKIGFAGSTTGLVPINGLRHPPHRGGVVGTSGAANLFLTCGFLGATTC